MGQPPESSDTPTDSVGTSDELMPPAHCPECGYNLRGTLRTGLCPECGVPANTSLQTRVSLCRLASRLPWWRIAPLTLGVVLLLTVALGYVHTTALWVCPDCARRESRTVHRFEIPFGGPLLFEIPGKVSRTDEPDNPLTHYLDPRNECTHKWIMTYFGSEGLTNGRLCTGLDPTRAIVADEPDFDRFVLENPGILDRIRDSIRKRHTIKGWVYEEYMQWKDNTCDD